MYTAVSAFTGFPAFQLPLYLLEHILADDGFVVVLNIVLRDFTLVDLFLFGEEVHRVGLLKECIALVLLVGEDAADGSGIPFFLAAWGLDAVSGQAGGNAIG